MPNPIKWIFPQLIIHKLTRATRWNNMYNSSSFSSSASATVDRSFTQLIIIDLIQFIYFSLSPRLITFNYGARAYESY